MNEPQKNQCSGVHWCWQKLVREGAWQESSDGEGRKSWTGVTAIPGRAWEEVVRRGDGGWFPAAQVGSNASDGGSWVRGGGVGAECRQQLPMEVDRFGGGGGGWSECGGSGWGIGRAHV